MCRKGIVMYSPVRRRKGEVVLRGVRVSCRNVAERKGEVKFSHKTYWKSGVRFGQGFVLYGRERSGGGNVR
jgi:hypothetical protein